MVSSHLFCPLYATDAPGSAEAVFLLALVAALGLAGWIGARLLEQSRQGHHPFPYQPRRPVPWRARHILVVALIFLLAPQLVYLVGQAVGLWPWLTQQLNLPAPPNNPPGTSPGQPSASKKPLASSTGQSSSAADRPVQAPRSPSLRPPAEPAPPAPSDQDLAHQVEQLLRQTNTWGVWAAVVVMTLLVAPLVEEWLFRAVLQGWLETLERNFLRTVRLAWRQKTLGQQTDRSAGFSLAPRWQSPKWLGVLPVVISSLLFASLHFRTAAPRPPADKLLQLFICQGLGNFLTLALAVAFLKISCQAQLSDFGLSCQTLPKQLAQGLLVYLVLIGPVYLLLLVSQILLWAFQADQLAPDPLPLFVLSLVLGILYFRTHRLLPCIVLHMAFNATGLAIFLLLS